MIRTAKAAGHQKNSRWLSSPSLLLPVEPATQCIETGMSVGFYHRKVRMRWGLSARESTPQSFAIGRLVDGGRAVHTRSRLC